MDMPQICVQRSGGSNTSDRWDNLLRLLLSGKDLLATMSRSRRLFGLIVLYPNTGSNSGYLIALCSEKTPRMFQKFITIVAWALLAFITYATLSPIQARPTLPIRTA